MKITEHEAKHYCDETLKLEAVARGVYFELAKRLYNIRNERLYEPFWDSWHTFTLEFKDLSPSSVSKLVQVYEHFVLRLGYDTEKLLSAGGWTKLYQLVPHATSRRVANKWLKLAETHTRQDLEKFIVEEKTGIDMTKCSHKDSYYLRICPDCGEKTRVYLDVPEIKKLSPSDLL